MIELCPEDGRIYLTCSGFVACFDPDAGTMSEVYSLYNAKSVSRSAAYGNLVQVAKDGGSNANWNARKLRVYPAAGGTDNAEVEPSPVVDMYRAKWLRSAPARWAPARPVVGHPAIEVDGETSATFSLPVVSLPVPPATLTLSVSNAVAATATISSAGTAVLAASVVPGTTSPYQIELVDADGQRSVGRGVVTVPGGPHSVLPVPRERKPVRRAYFLVPVQSRSAQGRERDHRQAGGGEIRLHARAAFRVLCEDEGGWRHALRTAYDGGVE